MNRVKVTLPPPEHLCGPECYYHWAIKRLRDIVRHQRAQMLKAINERNAMRKQLVALKKQQRQVKPREGAEGGGRQSDDGDIPEDLVAGLRGIGMVAE